MTYRGAAASDKDAHLLRPGAVGGVWRGAIAWQEHGTASTPWRIDPLCSAELSDGLVEVAQAAAGVRAEFDTDAQSALLVVERLDDEPGCVDVVVDGALRRRVPVHCGIQPLQLELDVDLKREAANARIELWLPQAGITRVHGLELEAATNVTAVPSARSRWIAYGSSITQCFEAAGPTDTWPARVARAHEWDLTCMGFSGECFLDEAAAETIAGAPADLITVCAGINVYNRAEWNGAELRSRLDAFLRTVRRGVPHAPIMVISPLASASRESIRNTVGMTLADVRAVVADVARQTTVPRVGYIDGTDVLGMGDQELLHDGLHPSAEGYAHMATRLRPLLATGMHSSVASS